VLTTAGANAQITSFLETQPGVQKVGESEGFCERRNRNRNKILYGWKFG
jgi:hypothetical protein